MVDCFYSAQTNLCISSYLSLDVSALIYVCNRKNLNSTVFDLSPFMFPRHMQYFLNAVKSTSTSILFIVFYLLTKQIEMCCFFSNTNKQLDMFIILLW